MYKKKYIFGIGSLVNSNSRKITLKKNTNSIPVILKNKNYNRIWTCLSKKKTFSNHSVLNLIKKYNKNNKVINGVLIPVNNKLLNLLDKRESRYKRIKINRKFFKTYKNKKIPKGTIYAYSSKNYNYPNKTCKLKQSYMDVTIDGFLKYDKNFAKKFKTKIKKNYTYNDRNNKIKYKNYNYKKKLDYKNIDKIIKENKLYY